MSFWRSLLSLRFYILPVKNNILELVIAKPSTVNIEFKNSVLAAAVYNELNAVYHFRTFEEPQKNFKVNFPSVGKYKIKGAVIDVKIEPLNYCDLSGFKLPEIERNRSKKGKTEIIFNPKLFHTPARIFTFDNKIEIGNKFLKYPFQIQKFILFHEIGHYFYKTEWKTDAFALYWFLKKGYNESNAYYALSKVLSRNENSIFRLEKMANHIINKTTK